MATKGTPATVNVEPLHMGAKPHITETDVTGRVFAMGWEPKRSTPKVGRNEPCSCGSGEKYKRCCGK